MNGFIVFILAIILYIPLTIVNIPIVIYEYGLKLRVLNGYFYETAYDIDRFGNRNIRALLNLTLRKPWGYEFGDERETISSVLGKNQQDETLTDTGKLLVRLLDKIDPNHCIKSINNFDNGKEDA